MTNTRGILLQGAPHGFRGFHPTTRGHGGDMPRGLGPTTWYKQRQHAALFFAHVRPID